MRTDGDSRERIFSAADGLFEQTGRTAFPSVDAVRKLARVNMNDASTAMKEWRRNQMGRTLPAPVRIPEAVQRSHGEALAALWKAAQETAGETLATMSAAWEIERGELEQLNKEMAEAFEAQAAELSQAREDAERWSKQAGIAEERSMELSTELQKSLANVARLQAAASLEAARGKEIELRAVELRSELDQLHSEWEHMAQVLVAPYRQQIEELKAGHAQERRRLREKLRSAHSLLHASQLGEAVMRGKYEEVQGLCRQWMPSGLDAMVRADVGPTDHGTV